MLTAIAAVFSLAQNNFLQPSFCF